MSKRKKPGVDRMIGMPAEEDKHQGMLSEMHDALYQLGDKIRKPFGGRGSKLLPKGLQENETPEAQLARTHIETMHGAMKDAKKY